MSRFCASGGGSAVDGASPIAKAKAMPQGCGSICPASDALCIAGFKTGWRLWPPTRASCSGRWLRRPGEFWLDLEISHKGGNQVRTWQKSLKSLTSSHMNTSQDRTVQNTVKSWTEDSWPCYMYFLFFTLGLLTLIHVFSTVGIFTRNFHPEMPRNFHPVFYTLGIFALNFHPEFSPWEFSPWIFTLRSFAQNFHPVFFTLRLFTLRCLFFTLGLLTLIHVFFTVGIFTLNFHPGNLHPEFSPGIFTPRWILPYFVRFCPATYSYGWKLGISMFFARFWPEEDSWPCYCYMYFSPWDVYFSPWDFWPWYMYFPP